MLDCAPLRPRLGDRGGRPIQQQFHALMAHVIRVGVDQNSHLISVLTGRDRDSWSVKSEGRHHPIAAPLAPMVATDDQ